MILYRQTFHTSNVDLYRLTKSSSLFVISFLKNFLSCFLEKYRIWVGTLFRQRTRVFSSLSPSASSGLGPAALLSRHFSHPHPNIPPKDGLTIVVKYSPCSGVVLKVYNDMWETKNGEVFRKGPGKKFGRIPRGVGGGGGKQRSVWFHYAIFPVGLPPSTRRPLSRTGIPNGKSTPESRPFEWKIKVDRRR